MSVLGIVVVIIAAIVALYLAVRLVAPWICRLADRGHKQNSEALLVKYELPVFFRKRPDGQLDLSARWRGWDGWYVSVVPDGKALPLQIIRAGLTTGLYGLEGIDNYEKLMWRLDTADAVEYVCLMPTEIARPGGNIILNYLSQHYRPKETGLAMETDRLDVAIMDAKVSHFDTEQRHGRIRGAWPNYQFDFINAEGQSRVSLSLRAERIAWFADFPGIYADFAIFGQAEGSIEYLAGTVQSDVHQFPAEPKKFHIRAQAALEHVSARRPYGFDSYWAPIRLFETLLPSYRPLRYHHEFLFGDGNWRAGFLKARAFGIGLRDAGCLFKDGGYSPMKRVRVKYLDPVLIPDCSGAGTPTPFYRRWEVTATTPEGQLRYIATATHPPALASKSMAYQGFQYEGTYRGEPISGRGYGEYLRM